MSKVKRESLKGKTLCFYFNRYNCFEINSKQCALVASDDVKEIYKELEEKAEPSHCPWIRDNIIYTENEKYFPLHIYKSKCGHYSMGSQHHRLCIAGQLGVSIPLIVHEEGSQIDCDYCSTRGRIGILKSF